MLTQPRKTYNPSEVFAPILKTAKLPANQKVKIRMDWIEVGKKDKKTGEDKKRSAWLMPSGGIVWDSANYDGLTLQQYEYLVKTDRLIGSCHYPICFGQGTTKAENKFTNIIYFECDSILALRSLEEKFQDDERLLGIPATIKIWTGSKSYHLIWVLDKFYPIEQAAFVQIQLFRRAKLIVGDGADGFKYTDEGGIGQLAPKTLRMPGSIHAKTGKRAECHWLEPQNIYTLDQIFAPLQRQGLIGEWDDKAQEFKEYKSPEQRQAEKLERLEAEKVRNAIALQRRKEREELAKLNASKSGNNKSINHHDGNGEAIDLLRLISKRNKEVFERGSGAGQRNNEGFALVQDLAACEAYVKNRGYEVEQSAGHLFYDYWTRSGADVREFQSKLDAARNKAAAGAIKPASTFVESKLNRQLGIQTENVTSDAIALATKYASPVQKVEEVAQDNEWGVVEVSEEIKAEEETKTKANQINQKVGWDFHKLITEYASLPKRNKIAIASWFERKHPKDSKITDGIVALGDLKQIKAQILDKQIKISDSSETRFESFVFWNHKEGSVQREQLCNVTPSENQIFAITKELKFKFLIDANQSRLFLLNKFKAFGLGRRLLALTSENRVWGAGAWFARLDEKIKADLVISRKYLIDLITKEDGETELDLGRFVDEICQAVQKKHNVYARPKIFFVKSEMGSGKTQFVKAIIKRCPDVKVLAIYALEKLAQAIAHELELLLYKNGVEGQSTNVQALLDDVKGLAIVANSLKKDGFATFDYTEWLKDDGSHRVLFLDEIESTLDSICNSATINNRELIMQTFKALIKGFAETDGCEIIISDANLKQSTIDFVRDCVGEDLWKRKTPLIVDNQYQKMSDRTAFIWDNKNELHSYALEKAQKQPVWISSDNRGIKEKTTTSTQALSLQFSQTGIQSATIDQHTTHTSDNKDYHAMARLIAEEGVTDDGITKDGKTSAIVSPSGATGLSVKNTHYSDVFGFMHGIVNLNIAQQMIERVRDDIPRHIYCNSVQLHQSSDALSKEQLELVEKYRENLHQEGINEVFAPFEESQTLQKIKEQYKDEPEEFKKWRHANAYLNAWEAAHLKVNLVASLQERGYKVEQGSLAAMGKTHEQITEQIEASQSLAFGLSAIAYEGRLIKTAELSETEVVEIMNDEEKLKNFRKVQEQSVRTEHQHLLVDAYRVKKWVGEETVVDKLVVETYNERRKQVERGFVAVCATTAMMRAIYSDLRYANEDRINSLKRETKSKMAELKLLAEKVDVTQLIKDLKMMGEYCERDRMIFEWNQRLLKYADDIHALFGVRLTHAPGKAIQNIGAMLRTCGFNQKKTKHASINGDRIRKYEIVNPDESIIQIWCGWLKSSNLERFKKDSLESNRDLIKKIFTEINMEWNDPEGFEEEEDDIESPLVALNIPTVIRQPELIQTE